MRYLPKQALPGGPEHYKIDRDCIIVTDSRNITAVSINGRSDPR